MFLNLKLIVISVEVILLFNDLIDFWCLMPLSGIFQLYHGDQF